MANKRRIKNTGFSSKYSDGSVRLINKDGSFNVTKTGRSFFQRFSVFQWMINTKWTVFFGMLILLYLLINLIFAAIYYSLGIEGLGLIPEEDSIRNYAQCFHFSTQTITTLGYGAISPVSNEHNLIAGFESYLGLLGFAISTGLLYARFSKPKVKMIYSNNAIIAPYKKIRGLMVRMANVTDSQLINAKAKMMLSRNEKVKNEIKRSFYFLDLELSSIGMMTSSWTLVHPIDEESPLSSFSEEEFVKSKSELIVTVEAYDESYSHEVHSRTSYTANEVVWDAKFTRILDSDDELGMTVDLSKIGHYKKLQP